MGKEGEDGGWWDVVVELCLHSVQPNRATPVHCLAVAAQRNTSAAIWLVLLIFTGKEEGKKTRKKENNINNGYTSYDAVSSDSRTGMDGTQQHTSVFRSFC